MANSNLAEAKIAKFDEFYTQYYYIEKEILAYLEYNRYVFRGKTVLLPCDDPEWSNFTKFFAQNFERLGLKKLISTSYAVDSKTYKNGYQPTLFEKSDSQFDQIKTVRNGKIFTLTHDRTGSRKVNVNDLEWHYLVGDGDFRSAEIKQFRDESDIIVTNPPFSLLSEFLAWIVEANKQFVIIANMNAITYKDIFPLIKENKLWLGATGNGSDMVFGVPAGTEVAESDKRKAAQLGYIGDYTRLGKSCWFTNLDHGRRHQPLPLMTMEDNCKFSKHKEVRGKKSYTRYDNYDAIEVPFTDAIPRDYDDVMGVPISFLYKYSPDQFQIVGMCENEDLYYLKTKVYTTAECKEAYFKKFGKKGTYDLNASGVIFKEGLLEKVFQRVLIKHRKTIK
ncbi:MAG: adenine-specific methyltransferase EcoRI family protein [Chloroflexi bacterium]|nr:adenine-specific methyltransferase EcoRI family protein [Chloroflexota bacterium]